MGHSAPYCRHHAYIANEVFVMCAELSTPAVSTVDNNTTTAPGEKEACTAYYHLWGVATKFKPAVIRGEVNDLYCCDGIVR